MNTITTVKGTFTGTTARTARHSLGLAALAVPMAAAIRLGAGTAAHADSQGQPSLSTSVALSGAHVNPDLPGPGELTDDLSCVEFDTCGVVPEDPKVNPDLPQGTDDFEVEIPCWQTDTCPPPVDPEVNPDLPQGTDDFEVETPCWQTDTCPPGDDDEDDGDDGTDDGGEDGTDDGGTDDGGDEGGEEPGGAGSGTEDGFDKPTRIDAGSATGDNGLQLAWLLPGGLLVSAGGMAFASRRLRGEPR